MARVFRARPGIAMIPYGRQEITQADIDAVVDVLGSERITQGVVVDDFERRLADYAGAARAVAANSGTSALHLACRALGLGPGDRLWTSPLSFVASANCARYCGAEVGFVDIDPASGNISVEGLALALRRARSEDRLPKIVVPVHFAGYPCEVEAIRALAREYGFRILEDASHALGARDAGGPIGHCRFADVAVFSFHPVKSITTGEGGALLTNDETIAEHAIRLRSHGVTRDPAAMSTPPEGPWYYEQTELGYNYRMTDIQAALGRSQLARLDGWIERRNALAVRYEHLLADTPVTLPATKPDSGRSACHLYVVRVDSRAARPRAAVVERLIGAGVAANVHYMPIHMQPYYRELGFVHGMYPEAEHFYREAITLPLFPGLLEEEQDHVAASLRKAVSP